MEIDKQKIIFIIVILFILMLLGYLYYTQYKDVLKIPKTCDNVYGYKDSTKNECVPCSGTNMYINSDKICTTCSSPTPYLNTDKKSCVANCTSGYLSNDTCVSYCTGKTPYIGNDNCVGSCSGTLPVFLNGNCIGSCSGTYPYNSNDTCVSSCTSSLPYLNNSNNKCVASCTGSGTSLINTVANTCVGSCSNTVPNTYNNTCVASCPSGTYLNNLTCYDNVNNSYGLDYSSQAVELLNKTGTVAWSGITTPPSVFTDLDKWIYTLPGDLTGADANRVGFQVTYNNSTSVSISATLNILVDDTLAAVYVNNKPLNFNFNTNRNFFTLSITLPPGNNLIEMVCFNSVNASPGGLLFNIKDSNSNVLVRSSAGVRFKKYL
jgi:hypothetical protein